MPLAALILGVLALILFFVPFIAQILGLLAIIFGIIAMVGAKKKGGKGFGMGIAGLITGGIGMFLSIAIVAALLLPAITNARGMAQRLESSSNMKQIVLHEMIYRDEEGAPSPDFKTLAAHQQLSDKLFQSPFAPGRMDSYTMLPTDGSLGSRHPIIAEDPQNYGNSGTIVGFADGSVQFIEGQAGLDYYQIIKALSQKAADENRPIGRANMQAIKRIDELMMLN